MPERVTKEERMVSLAIEKARKTIETMRESTQVIPYDSEVEVQKIKRPKVQDASKITNQTQDKEGYGLAGESLKKSMILKFDDESALNGENVREANSLAPRFVGPHFSINLKRDEITKVLKEFNKKYPNVRLYQVTNGDEYISAFVNLAAYLYPKNVGRTFSNIGESQFKKSSLKKSRAFAVGVDRRLNELKAYIRDNPEGYPPAMTPSDVKAVMKAIENIENIMGKFN